MKLYIIPWKIIFLKKSETQSQRKNQRVRDYTVANCFTSMAPVNDRMCREPSGRKTLTETETEKIYKEIEKGERE